LEGKGVCDQQLADPFLKLYSYFAAKETILTEQTPEFTRIGTDAHALTHQVTSKYY
jgi:hypothetical protein